MKAYDEHADLVAKLTKVIPREGVESANRLQLTGFLSRSSDPERGS